INDYIVLLFNENKVLYKKSIDGIKTTYLSKINVLFGASLQFTGLKNLRTYVKQAIYAIKKGQKRKPEAKFFIFYRYALDYVLESNSIEEKLCACHPDVIELWKKEKESESYELQTLKEYLRCERSLLKASENLFIHRNTLLYRELIKS
ncbi:MAG: PucR family transcriptional regulator, partial [Firmicutes bacterium]|nr:PucR family transcriptional regulator [Bacillota bacterium]